MNCTGGIRGEIGLWRAVISQAMQDALSQPKSPEMKYWKTQALHWLTHGSRDLADVCDMALMNADYVRRKAALAMESGGQWREEAGKSIRYLKRKEYRRQLKLRRMQ